MTVEWFDLGQRLHAAATGRPAPRLLHAPLPPLTDPVAVRARSARGRLTVTAATPGQPPATAEGEDALALLRDRGVVMNAVEPPTLVTDDPATLPLLVSAARATAPDGELTDVAAELTALPAVLEAYATTGSSDVLCRIAASSHQDLQNALLALSRSPYISRSTSVVVLSTVVPPRTLPLLANDPRSTPRRAPAYRDAP